MCFHLQSMSHITCHLFSGTASAKSARLGEQTTEWVDIVPHFPCVSHGSADTSLLPPGGRVSVTCGGILSAFLPSSLPRISASP